MLFILHFQGPRLYETTIQLGAKCKTETILIGPLNFLMEMRTKIQIIGKKLFPSLSLSCIHRLQRIVCLLYWVNHKKKTSKKRQKQAYILFD